jgi:tetratricopeptide (TPR) repeat protein
MNPMATERQTNPRKNFTPRFLPWFLTAAIFVIYWLTLNHWVGLFPLSIVSLNNPPVYLDSLFVSAKAAGWIWQPEFYQPVFFAVTYPFHWLPATQITVALNLFSAVCAALTLGLLARSVAILPHDRTEAQRKREGNDFSFLTIGSACLPPIFAVAACGLQMTFWEQATNCTGEMFHLLLFAFVIWSLLEYRLDECAGRLFLAAAVYGAGMTDDWALIGFLPVFIGAIIWIRGLSFFNSSFLVRMMACGLAGLLFYLLLPLLAVAAHKIQVTFWQALKLNLSAEWGVVKLFFTRPEVRFKVGLLSLISLLPVLVLSIRWQSSFGDNSKIGQALTNFMFHLVHAIMLFVCVWVAFDPPFSPRHSDFGLSFLTFYYLGALSVGYYSGYFLLVFGRQVESRSRHGTTLPVNFLNRLAVGAVWLFALFAMTGLVYKNVPQIRGINDDTFKKYTALTEENLPRAGGILLSDDSRRLFLVQAALTQDGRAKDFAFADTSALSVPAYHHYLQEKFPDKWPDTISAAEKTNGISPLHLIGLLAALAQTNELYYLHPSFGYYFEQFCMEPHGLIYKLNTLPNDTLLPPLPDKNQIAANQNFWGQADKTTFAPIIQALTPQDPHSPHSFGEQLLGRFHVAREPNPNAAVVGAFYSRSLDFWGVQLQRADDLTNAAIVFEKAQQLNPDNFVADVNLQFNQNLRAGKVEPVDLSKTTADKLGKYRSWDAVLGENGPFDETSFCFKSGAILVQGGLLRQAVEPFNRVRQLVPHNLAARLWLAQCYLASRLSDRALDTLRDPMDQPEIFPVDETNSMQLNLLAAAAYFQKDDNARGIQLVKTEISRQPTNEPLLVVATQIYLKRGLFTNALDIIDRKLQATPDDPTWLYGKGFASIQIKAYDDAITAFTHLLTIQTTNNEALFYRAVANLQSGKLDASRADYEKLGQSFTNSFLVAYGLGEIAWRKHETNEAIKNYEAYLNTANTYTAEATNIIQRLRDLKGQPH